MRSYYLVYILVASILLMLGSCGSNTIYPQAQVAKPLVLPAGTQMNYRYATAIGAVSTSIKQDFLDIAPVPPTILSSSSNVLVQQGVKGKLVGMSVNIDQRPCLRISQEIGEVRQKLIASLESLKLVAVPVKDTGQAVFEMLDRNNLDVYQSLVASYVVVKQADGNYLDDVSAKIILEKIYQQIQTS
jgi:hypothetical protein